MKVGENEVKRAWGTGDVMRKSIGRSSLGPRRLAGLPPSPPRRIPVSISKATGPKCRGENDGLILVESKFLDLFLVEFLDGNEMDRSEMDGSRAIVCVARTKDGDWKHGLEQAWTRSSRAAQECRAKPII